MFNCSRKLRILIFLRLWNGLKKEGKDAKPFLIEIGQFFPEPPQLYVYVRVFLKPKKREREIDFCLLCLSYFFLIISTASTTPIMIITTIMATPMYISSDEVATFDCAVIVAAGVVGGRLA